MSNVNAAFAEVERKMEELKAAIYQFEAEYTPVDVDVHAFINVLDNFMVDLDTDLQEAELAGVL